MSAHRTPEQALEILAREMYVANQTVHNPDDSPRHWRGQWYLALTDDNRAGWRQQAAQVVESLGESDLELTWKAE